MIVTNIIDWIDLGDNIQNLEVYAKKYLYRFLSMMRLLLNYKRFSILFYIFLMFVFFLQILIVTLTNMQI